MEQRGASGHRWARWLGLMLLAGGLLACGRPVPEPAATTTPEPQVRSSAGSLRLVSTPPAAPTTAVATATAPATATDRARPTPTPRRETAEQRCNRERTNQGGKAGCETEGDVLETECGRSPPELVVANIDGRVVIRLQPNAVDCALIQPGDYLLVVEGEKHHEHLYDAYEVWVERR